METMTAGTTRMNAAAVSSLLKHRQYHMFVDFDKALTNDDDENEPCYHLIRQPQGFCKRLSSCVDSKALKEVALSAARETGCP